MLSIIGRTARRYYRTARELAYVHRTFSDLESMRTWRQLRRLRAQRHPQKAETSDSGEALPLRVRILAGKTVYCRPGTTDILVFDDTFRHQYHLPPGDLKPIRTVLDLGSNIGLTIAHFASLYPGATILGVELDAGNFELCQRNIEPYRPRCRALLGAVWAEDGEVCYEGDSEWGFHVSASPRVGWPVKAYSMQTLMGLLGVAAVDFVKMDVEGAEGAIFENAQSWVERVRCLKVEVHSPCALEGCKSRLEALGLRCERDGKHPACIIATNHS